MMERKILNIYDKHDLAKLLVGTVNITSPELSSNSLRQGIDHLSFVYKKSEEPAKDEGERVIVAPKVSRLGTHQINQQVSSNDKKSVGLGHLK